MEIENVTVIEGRVPVDERVLIVPLDVAQEIIEAGDPHDALELLRIGANALDLSGKRIVYLKAADE